MVKDSGAGNDLKRENERLKLANEELNEKVRELEETLEAIRSGEVDAIVITNGEGRKVYTLEGADHPYRVLVENIREGALTLSHTGMILYTNTRFADMVKLPADKIAGTSILDFVCPEHQADMEDALREILNRSCRSRLRIRQGVRGSLPVLISMNPLTTDADTKISVVVTDRRKDEDRIMLQARMLDAVGDAVIAADTKNKIIYWNDAATKTYGWEPEEALGRDLIEVATPKISHREAREIADRLKKGETWTGEYVVKHRDGHEFPIYASDAPIFDDDGKLIAIIGASHDITSLKRTEDELRKKHDDLNAAYEEITATQEELRQNLDELTRAEKTLSESEEKFRVLFTQMVEGSALHEIVYGASGDPVDYRILDINPSFECILGLKREDVIGKTSKEAYGVDTPPYFEHYRRVTETGQSEEFEVFFAPMNKHFSVSAYSPEPGKFATIFSDITDRKMAEETLLEKDHMLAESQRLAHVGTWKMDLSTGDVSFSEEALRIIGLPPGKHEYSDFRDRVCPEDRSRRDAEIQEAIEHDKPYRSEFLIILPEGSVRHIRAIGDVTKDSRGRPVTLTVTIQDDTEHAEAVATLRESEEKFRTIVETANEGIWVVDANLKTTFANEKMARILGYLPGEMPGKSALDFMDEEGRTLAAERLKERVLGTRGSYEHKYLRKDGSEVWTYANVTPLKDAEGRFAGSIGMLTDITERKQIEKTLKRSLAEKEILLSEIHHRVKNNLAAFISLLSLEGSYVETPEGQALKKDLQNRARTMALIHETLYKTRQYSEVNMELYLSTLIDQVVNSYRSTQSIRTFVDAKGISLGLGSATPIGLIINELVTNSLKYAFPLDSIQCQADRKEPCTIGIRLIKEDGTYLLIVSDNGIGLPKDLNIRTTKSLGLKLVNFIARHQLRADLEIRTKNGTEFVFRFKERDHG